MTQSKIHSAPHLRDSRAPGAREFRNLRRVLLTNAATSALVGLLLVALPSVLGAFMVPDGGTVLGVGPAGWLTVAGLGLLVFVAFVAAVAATARPRPGLVAAIIAMDVSWVAGSALLLIFAGAALSWPAWIAVILAADLVAVFAWLQFRFLRAGVAAARGTSPAGAVRAAHA